MTDIVSHGRGDKRRDKYCWVKRYNFEAGDIQPSVKKVSCEE